MIQNSQTSSGPRELSQRDVVFTPLMLRVRDVLDGADRSAPLRLRLSPVHPIAAATDEWFYLRARSEQVIAEANAMAVGRAAPVHWRRRLPRACVKWVRRVEGALEL